MGTTFHGRGRSGRAAGHSTLPTAAVRDKGVVARREDRVRPPPGGIESGLPDGKEHASMKNGLTRLTEPMVRDNGGLRTATWDEALDRAASGLRAATERNAGDGVGLFSCSKATNEMNFVAQKFMRQVLRSNNIDSCNRT
jgi:formate dehydrogenase major subunit